MARYENGEETRDLILQSAWNLIYEKGLGSFTFGDLADDAHVSRTSVIYHFKNKTNLNAELSYNQFYDRMNDITEVLQTSRFSYMITSYIFWYHFFSDEKYRRWFLSMNVVTEQDEKRWLEAMYQIMIDSFEITESQESFLQRNEFAGVLLCGMVERLYRHVSENLDKYIFFEVADQEVQVTARIFGIPDEQIAKYLSEARRVLQLVDFTQFHWTPQLDE